MQLLIPQGSQKSFVTSEAFVPDSGSGLVLSFNSAAVADSAVLTSCCLFYELDGSTSRDHQARHEWTFTSTAAGLSHSFGFDGFSSLRPFCGELQFRPIAVLLFR